MFWETVRVSTGFRATIPDEKQVDPKYWIVKFVLVARTLSQYTRRPGPNA